VKEKLRRPLIYAVFAAATVLGVGLGGPSRAKTNTAPAGPAPTISTKSA